MEQTQYLIDTNVIIDFLGNTLPMSGLNFLLDVIDAVPNISVVTKMEALGYKASDEHSHVLLNFISDSNVLHLTNEVVDCTIEIRKTKK